MLKEMPRRPGSDVAACMAVTDASGSGRNCFWELAAFARLKAMGITPGVLHLNEGHSAFAILEAIRDRMQEEGVGFDEAVGTSCARSRLHHAYTCSGRSRPIQLCTD